MGFRRKEGRGERKGHTDFRKANLIGAEWGAKRKRKKGGIDGRPSKDLWGELGRASRRIGREERRRFSGTIEREAVAIGKSGRYAKTFRAMKEFDVRKDPAVAAKDGDSHRGFGGKTIMGVGWGGSNVGFT